MASAAARPDRLRSINFITLKSKYFFALQAMREFFSKPYQDRIARLSIFQFTQRVVKYVAPIIHSNRGYRLGRKSEKDVATGNFTPRSCELSDGELICLDSVESASGTRYFDIPARGDSRDFEERRSRECQWALVTSASTTKAIAETGMVCVASRSAKSLNQDRNKNKVD